GRTLADVVTNCLSIAVMLVVGVIAGFSFDAPLLHIVAGILILLLFGYAFSWVFAFVGLTSSSPEASQSLGFIVIFPLTFVSSASPPSRLLPPPPSPPPPSAPAYPPPAPLQPSAEAPPSPPAAAAWPLLSPGPPAGNDVWGAVAWSIGIAVVFAALSIRRYKR